jgi:dihydroorotase
MHLHLREADMLKTVAPLSARHFAGGIVMPNLIHPVDSRERLLDYRDAVRAAVHPEVFEPYMTLFFKPYDAAFLKALKSDIIGIKLYPAGITTQSEAGVKCISDAESTLALMAELGIPLLVHGETNGFVMDREAEFIEIYDEMAQKFPALKIIMEHITTREAVAFLDQHPRVYATVTLHHLLITLDDVAGGLLAPHLFCKPLAKRPEDLEALRRAVFGGHPKIMFGSDSAPHPRNKKECAGCAAGVFTAPVALPMLAELFDAHQVLDRLQGFVSDKACAIYGLHPPPKTVELVKSNWRVPDSYGPVVPFGAGQVLSWQIKE